MANLEIIKKALTKTLKRHKEKFDFFGNWNGWEKWLQVELAHELNNYGQATVEEQYIYHKGKKLPVSKLDNSNAFIDIVFRKNNDSVDFFSAIELTVGRTQKSLRKVLSDLLKIKALKKTEWEFRSVFVILAFEKNYIRKTKFVKLCESIEEQFSISPIYCSGFTFLVFGWEPHGLKSNMNNYDYTQWLHSLNKIYKQHDVIAKVSTKNNSSPSEEAQ